MLIRLIISRTGGMWKLKERCQRTRWRPLRALFMLLYRAGQFESGCSVAWNSGFDGPPFFPHGWHGIFVSGEARVGKNCIIFQQVTIGSNALPDSKGVGAPTIGDGCFIGAGAKIIGGVTIGGNVRIGANAVVYEDVPDNSVVISNTQTTITKEEPLNNHFYTWRGWWDRLEDGVWVREEDPEVLKQLDGVRRNT